MTFLEFQRPGLNIADQGRGRFTNRVGEVKKQWSNPGAGSRFLLREYTNLIFELFKGPMSL